MESFSSSKVDRCTCRRGCCQQVLEGRALPRQRHTRIRPVQLTQQRRGIKNVLLRALGPLAFNQANQKDLVEFPISGRLRIKHLDAAGPRAGREGLSLYPSAQHGGDFDNPHRRVVEMSVREAQASAPPR